MAEVDTEQALWLRDEIVGYFQIYDHHDVWRPKGAEHLARWIVARGLPQITHIPIIVGHCDAELHLGCECGWRDTDPDGWAAHR